MKIRRALLRAYTVVEVMMALSVLSIGATGIVAMQKATLIGNTRARDLATASALASTWIERLQYDARNWTFSAATNTPFFGAAALVNQPQNVWLLPPAGVGAMAGTNALTDVKGMDTTDLAEGAFCVNYRLTPVSASPLTPLPVTSALRAEVRVYWLRVHHTSVDPARAGALGGGGFCSAAEIPLLESAAGPEHYHFVYASTALLRRDIP